MKLLIPLCVLLTTLTWVHGDANIFSDQNMQQIASMGTAMLEMLTLPPLPNDFKTDLYIYTIDKDTIKTANKFQCADIYKKGSLYDKNKDTVILVSNKKAKDGTERIGKKLKDINKNYIYLAYTDGKSPLAQVKPYTVSMISFLKCLIDNGVYMKRISIEDNQFSAEIGWAMAVLLSEQNQNKIKTEL